MIKIYSFAEVNRRTKQARAWLLEHDLQHQMITKDNLTLDILKKILIVSDNGFDDVLISEQRTKIYKKMKSVTKMTTMQLFEKILENPKLLKEPIIFDDNKMLTGYNSEEIRKFLPRDRKK
ncbi:ArsC/Spx/MgsR family protein [Lactococcus lactis]|nr:ArsC/Spx/MgsR family protein [Lactococcus lactis]